MKIEIYAMRDTKLNSDELVGYSFNVVMVHEDGAKSELGEYSVSTDNMIEGGISYEATEDDQMSPNRVKSIILNKGLEDIVAGAETPRKYFWKNHITFSPNDNLSGAFERAEELYNSDKVIRTTSKEYMTMMDRSVVGTIPGLEEFEFDNSPYEDSDESGKGSRRR